MVIFLLVLPFLDPKRSMASTIFMPSFTFQRPHACHPTTQGNADEKLGTICVGASICHGQDARTCMLQNEILIIKFLAIDGLATSTIMACEVTTLAHKSQDYSVKAGTFITKSFLSSAQSSKVFCCLWNFVCKQLKRDAAQGLAVDSDVEEHGGVDHG